MLMWLAEQWKGYASFLNLFQYVTFRSIMAALTALSISLALGPRMIDKLQRKQYGQPIREDGPQSHLKKAGTPTMGGTLIILSVVLATLLWADVGNRYVWCVVLVTLAFGLVGLFLGPVILAVLMAVWREWLEEPRLVAAEVDGEKPGS